MRNYNSNKDLITFEEASQLSGLDEMTLFSWMKANKIHTFMILESEHLYIRREDFNKMMNANTILSEMKGGE